VFFIRYKLRLKKYLSIKHGRLNKYRTFIFLKIYSSKSYGWRQFFFFTIWFESFSYEVIRTRFGAQCPEPWSKFGYIKLCVDGDLNCGLHLALPLWQYLEQESERFQDVYGVEQQSIAVLHSRQCHCSTGRTAIYRCTAQQTVPL